MPNLITELFLFAADVTEAGEGGFDRRILLIFPLIVLPFLLPALFGKIYPTRRVLTLLAIPLIVLSVPLFIGLVGAKLLMPTAVPFVTTWLEMSAWLFLAVDLTIALALAFDLWATLPLTSHPFDVERQVDRIASLSRRHPVKLKISNKAKRGYRISVRDDSFPSLAPDTDVFSERLLPGRSAETLEYEMAPQERGQFRLEETTVRVRSLLGFWCRYITIPCANEISVYPNLRQISEYDLLARSDRLHQLGVRVARRVGQDNDFERLRDYQLDDQYKFIDWTATARRQKLTVKDFQASQSQRIIFLVDCGRMMTNLSDDGLTLLDHSLNATLMLSYIALQRYDSVGMISFSNRIINYIPPGTGERQMSRLLHGFFNLFPEPVESRYDEAFGYLSTRCRKRSLVVLITNVTDQVNAKVIQSHLTNLTGRHLPLGVFLRDHQIFDPVSRFFETIGEIHQPTGEMQSAQHSATTQNSTQIYERNADFWRAGAAADVLNWRHKVITDLKHQGTLTLDLFPESMTAPMINKYLEIKARHLL